MTRSVHIVERMRWMSALAGAAIWRSPPPSRSARRADSCGAVASGSSTGSANAAGSSAVLDPRIATLADHHPGAVVQAIVQFNAPVSPAKADKRTRPPSTGV